VNVLYAESVTGLLISRKRSFLRRWRVLIGRVSTGRSSALERRSRAGGRQDEHALRLYRSVGECVVDLWNREVSLRICELSERDPEIDVVAEVVAEDASDTHADYEVYIRAMAFTVLSQDVREMVESTVRIDAKVPDSRDAHELPE
jgi:hypothetical protein